MTNDIEQEKRMDTTEQEQNNVAEENAGATEGTGPPAPEPRRMTRSSDDVVVAGVASGLAKHLKIDPLIVRIAFAVGTLAGGLGFLLYLVGWVMIPEEGSDRALGYSREGPLRAVSPWIVATVVGIAGLILITEINIWENGAFFWAVLLIGGGVLLYRMDGAPPRPASPPTPATTPPPSSPAEGGGPSSTQPLPVVTETPRPKPRKERSYLGRYTFAAMLLILGVTAMLDTVGTFNLRAEQYPAIALLVVGAGLLVGTLMGRSRSMIFLGIMIVPLALISTLVRVPMEGGFGERSYRPAEVEGVEDVYRLTAGRMKFDLTNLKWGAEPVELEATVVAGSIEIVVPRGVAIDFQGRVGAGRIDFLKEHRDGYNVDFGSTFGDSPTGPLLVIDSEVSFGYIQITSSDTPRKGAR